MSKLEEQAEAELQKYVDGLWEKHERRRNIRIPDKSRREVMRKFPFTGSLGSESDVREYLKDLDGHITDRFNYGKWALGVIGERVDARGEREETDGQVIPREKAVRRRMRIIDFVSRDWLTMGDLVDRKFKSRPRRINWKAICDEWNTAYPYDRMKEEGLRVAFHRAISQPKVQQEYFDRTEDIFLIMDRERIDRALIGPDTNVRGILEPLLKRYRDKGIL